MLKNMLIPNVKQVNGIWSGLPENLQVTKTKSKCNKK